MKLTMKRYIKIWWMMAVNAFQDAFVSRLNAVVLITGKIIRFLFFLFFLFIIGSKTRLIAGYSLPQMIFFYLTFQLVDTLPQLLMREVYRFRGYVVSGDFDYFLVKPLSPLLRGLFGGSDVLDIPMTIIAITALAITIMHLPNVSMFNILLYVLLILNAFTIAVALHIVVLSLGVVTTEVDNAIMLYRDLTQMGRIPVDIYKEPLRGLITFVIPVGIMMTVPAKALFGLISFPFILLACGVAVVLLWLSLQLWNNALKHYGSASS